VDWHRVLEESLAASVQGARQRIERRTAKSQAGDIM